jgi:hypothetical protein
MTTADSIKFELLSEGMEDFLGLWEFLWIARESMGIQDPETAKEVALAMVREFIEEGLVIPGNPVEPGPDFDPWNLSPDETMSRIEDRWKSLGHAPTTGEIAWFVTTLKGESWVRAYDRKVD